MSKVFGVILTIIGGMAALFTYFVYLNSSAYLIYNPADSQQGLLEAGLSVPIVASFLALASGILILATSREPQKK